MLSIEFKMSAPEFHIVYFVVSSIVVHKVQ